MEEKFNGVLVETLNFNLTQYPHYIYLLWQLKHLHTIFLSPSVLEVGPGPAQFPEIFGSSPAHADPYSVPGRVLNGERVQLR